MNSDLCPPRLDYDVVIAGAGPVGLTLAALLERQAFRVLILEKRPERGSRSRAIGVTPPSLEILARIGLDQPSVERGLPIRFATVHGHSEPIGDLEFDHLPGRFPFILSLPQATLEGLLEEHLTSRTTVDLHRGTTVTGFEETAGGVRIHCHGESGVPAVEARWLVACDGAGSSLREFAGISWRGHDYECRFAMADFTDLSDLGEVAHLYFSRHGTVESFPLPDGQRRWIVQQIASGDPVRETDPEANLVAIRRRTGWAPGEADRLTEWSAFRPQWQLCDRFFLGRTVFCGDAAHVMSPIGGQGMNTGLADAAELAQCLRRIREGSDSAAEWQAYDRTRRRAFRTASRFAAVCMWIGTRRGFVSARIRDRIIAHVLRLSPARPELARRFAMLPGPARVAGDPNPDFESAGEVLWH